MKIKTNIYAGLEIEIKARGLDNAEHYNKEDTMAFLNWMCVTARNAAKVYEEKGFTAMQRETQKFTDILYEALDERGYYDNIRQKGIL